MVVAVALVAALAAAFAVPQSRSAILRFFHLGGVTVVRVETLPPAQERPLAAGLGEQVSDDEAARALGAPFLPRSPRHALRTGWVRLDGSAGPGTAVGVRLGVPDQEDRIRKGRVRGRRLGRDRPLDRGPPHVVVFPDASPRLAGNVLVWAKGGVTFRLEGRGLDEETALKLAREILGTTGS